MINIHYLIYTALIYSGFSFGIAVLMVAIKHIFYSNKDFLGRYDIIFFNIVSLSSTWFYTKHTPELITVLIIAVPFYIFAYRKLKNFYVSGKLLLTTNLLFFISSLVWGLYFIHDLEASYTTLFLIYAGYPLIILSLFTGLVTTFEQWEILCRKKWNRPKEPQKTRNPEYSPMISIHVPCYSEPPELVQETLNAISRLDYDNYEVIVIDNNTKDPDLWKPVQNHCGLLGSKFRFFHADNIKGAKAGALNYIMKYVSQDADIIAVIDADYQPQPDFINSLVGYFEDPGIGFVQTPHDYREWGKSLYQRFCYWEYKYFFETTMPSLNERDTALTVGTMCLIRRKALEEAGGWAEWCCTEDSELSIRIHALGYSSVYVNKTYGRGLIPETFSGYKKQRFRWTYGPVQELKRYYRLYLPAFISLPSMLTMKQKIHHLNHGVGYLNIGLGFLLTPLYILTLLSMTIHKETINVPGVIFHAGIIYIVGTLILKLLVYRRVMNCSLVDTIGAYLASNSLNHTYITASLMCMVTREIPWVRTNKFKSLPLGLNSLGQVQSELIIGLLFISIPVVAYFAIPYSGFHYILATTLAIKSTDYFSAPLLAMLSEYDLRNNHLEDTLIKNKVLEESKSI